jgi:cytochrome c oxidase cbb3-type subunit 3
MMRSNSAFSALTVLLVGSLFFGLGCKKKPTPVQARGAAVYAQMCSVCHGQSGEGYKADQATALRHPNFLGSVTDSYLHAAISNGRRGTTMSAWAKARGGPLSPVDVDAVIAFLHTWDPKTRATLDERPLAGDAGRGAITFARECVSCHGASGIGGLNVNIGNRELLASATNGYLRYAIRNGRDGTAMLAFEKKLGDQSIDDIVLALRNFQAAAPPTAVNLPPKPAPLPLGPVPLNPKGPEPVGFKASPGTTPAEVIHAQLERHAKIAVLDARAPSDYMGEHIAGAVSVPFYDPDPYIDKLPKTSWIVCYCACPHAESGQLAQKLVAHGFTKVTVLDEGLGFWRSKGFATSKGANP